MGLALGTPSAEAVQHTLTSEDTHTHIHTHACTQRLCSTPPEVCEDPRSAPALAPQNSGPRGALPGTRDCCSGDPKHRQVFHVGVLFSWSSCSSLSLGELLQPGALSNSPYHTVVVVVVVVCSQMLYQKEQARNGRKPAGQAHPCFHRTPALERSHKVAASGRVYIGTSGGEESALAKKWPTSTTGAEKSELLLSRYSMFGGEGKKEHASPKAPHA
eukprot:664252-Pelagomonas_calceolata.AAC.8